VDRAPVWVHLSPLQLQIGDQYFEGQILMF